MALSPNDKSWWRRAVLYQVYPRSVQDSDGDGVGDLLGLQSRLSYFAELGVDALWVSPFFKSPMLDFGYDVEDHRAVDPLFGTLEDFDRLLEAAHAYGIRILIDLVLSHTALTHPWFQASRRRRGGPYDAHYVWADPQADGSPPNNWLSVFGGPAWTWEPMRGQYYLHNFLSSQPDLNFHHPEVREEALSVARWWLERGVDGFRLDTVNFYFHDKELRSNPALSVPDNLITHTSNPYGRQQHLYDKNRPEVLGFLEELGALLDEFPGSVALGEIGAGRQRCRELMNEYLQPGRLHLCYSFELLNDLFSAEGLREFISQTMELPPEPRWSCLSLSNHDVTRAATRLGPPDAAPELIAPLSLALLLALPGTPCVYQGEELGLPEAEIPFELLVDPYGKAFWPTFKGRDGCRTPMPWSATHAAGGFTSAQGTPWLPLSETHRRLAVDQQRGYAGSTLEQTRLLIQLRREHPALHDELIELLLPDGPADLLAFSRGAGAEAILCLFNLSAAPVSCQLPEGWEGATLLLGSASAEEQIQAQLELSPWGWSYLKRPAKG